MKHVIITAASEKYKNSLFSLIGSLNCNWPTHPPIIVYDLGLDKKTVALFKSANIEVKEIPKFCDHWRSHYTWKLWCLNHTDADVIIWMDAGICILDSMDEIINIIEQRTYFLVPNFQYLDIEASENACIACGVPYAFRQGKESIAGSLIGFLKKSEFGKLIHESYQISLTEINIKASNENHRHDQSIISLLLYKYYANPVLEDGILYLGWKSPRMIKTQKIWLQRRQILKEDMLYFKKHLANPGNKYIPKDPYLEIGKARKLLRSSFLQIKLLGKLIVKNKRLNGIR